MRLVLGTHDSMILGGGAPPFLTNHSSGKLTNRQQNNFYKLKDKWFLDQKKRKKL